MSSTTSDSEKSQNDSEYNFFPGNVFGVEYRGSQFVLMCLTKMNLSLMNLGWNSTTEKERELYGD